MYNTEAFNLHTTGVGGERERGVRRLAVSKHTLFGPDGAQKSSFFVVVVQRVV